MTATRLGADAIPTLLATLPQWQYAPQHGGSITREFACADFIQAFGFMSQLALVAERQQHHPDWRNVYNRLTITLSTHDAQGLSMRDIEFAREADRLWRQGRFVAPT